MLWNSLLKVGTLTSAIHCKAYKRHNSELTDGGDLLLASAAQDSLIRVWRISRDTGDEQAASSTLQSTQGKFTVHFNGELAYKCLLETVLQGHENWVYGLHWQPRSIQGKQRVP